MSASAHSFYRRLSLLTAGLPALVLGMLFYGTALLLWPVGLLTQVASAIIGQPLALSGFLLLAFIGLSRILSWLGFMASGVPARRRKPDATQQLLLDELLARGSAVALPLAPQLVELGPVPYLAAGGLTGNELWISTHTLGNTPLSVLRCMVAHEAGHVVLGSRRLGCAWVDLTWLAAYVVADLLAQWPLAIAAAAALHISLWLRLQAWYAARAEEAADRWAAQQTSLLGYARSLAVYMTAIEQPGGPLLRRRLAALGLEPEQLEMIMEEARRSVAG